MSTSVCSTAQRFDHVLDRGRQEKTVCECIFPPVSREEVVQFAMKPEDGFAHECKPITLTGSEARPMAKGAPQQGRPLLRLKVASNISRLAGSAQRVRSVQQL